MAARLPMLLVSPDGYLHVVADLDTLRSVSKHHDLRNDYMRNMVGVKTKALKTQRKEASTVPDPARNLKSRVDRQTDRQKNADPS